MVKYFLLTTVNLLFIVAAANVWGLRVNTTESYPEGVYRLVGPVWQRQDLVESCLPIAVRDFALSRGYLKAQGRCDGHPSVIKRVFAAAGDTVSRDGVDKPPGKRGQQNQTSLLSINGMAVENSGMLLADGQGRALQAAILEGQSITVAENSVWLMSLHSAESFDSRYFGAIPEKYVLGKLEPLWVF